MKKNILFITGIFLLIMVVLTIMLINIQSNNKRLQQVNIDYEYYLNRNIFGTELATLINKAIDNNKRLEIPKDENGFYIANDTDSILITIQMLNVEETYQMEKIFALGTSQFIELFNSSMFKSEQVTYHEKTGRIATILFKQIE